MHVYAGCESEVHFHGNLHPQRRRHPSRRNHGDGFLFVANDDRNWNWPIADFVRVEVVGAEFACVERALLPTALDFAAGLVWSLSISHWNSVLHCPSLSLMPKNI